MRKLFGFLCVFAALLAGCADKYDDSEIRGDLAALEERVQTLETLCSQMNTNISSLQTLVNALQQGDYVTNVSPVTQEGETVGYTISFLKSAPITIYNGKDGEKGEKGEQGEQGIQGEKGEQGEQGLQGEKGKDGYTPAIGVRQDTDGAYYWTLDGEWLLDNEGNKVKASGSDAGEGGQGEPGTPGKDGITPQLKIENDYWYVSYDNGASWTQLGKATGDSGESIFDEVTQDENNIYFVLTSGETITLPKRIGLTITFSETKNIACLPGKNITVTYETTGAQGEVIVMCLAENGWEATVSGSVSGEITITAPDPMTNGKVLVFATDEMGQSAIKALTFTEGTLTLVTAAYEVEAEGGIINVPVTTNMDYEVYIPEDAQSWLSQIMTKAVSMRTDTLQFSATTNPDEFPRTANVELRDAMGDTIQTFTIVQELMPPEDMIQFADAKVGEKCVYYFDTNENGIFTKREAESLRSLVSYNGGVSWGLFNNSSIVSFDELQYFTNLRMLFVEEFLNCTQLKSIILPPSLEKIWDSAFQGCSSLPSISIPDNVTNIEKDAFSGCTSLASVTLSKGLTTISDRIFSGCSNLTSINIPEGVTSIGSSAFSGCSSLTSINLPESATNIKSRAFEGCSKLAPINLPKGITEIESYVFSGCSSLVSIDIPEGVTTIGTSAFEGCSSLTFTTFPESLRMIKDYAFKNCSDLVYVTLPEGMRSIGYNAFAGCSNLTNINLPESLDSIRMGAFNDCNSLITIRIPKGVTYVADCFANCNNLTTVYCYATNPPGCGGSYFLEDYSHITLYVPVGCKAVYETADYWKDFGNIVEMDF